MNGRSEADGPYNQPLTPREKEILGLIGSGKTNRQIAAELTVAMSTVKWYVRQIYNKLTVDNRSQAITRAREMGLLVREGQDGGVRHNLPGAATPFVGRETELSALGQLITDPQVHVITVTGPGGIGKTRLVMEAAGRELASRSKFRDGIFFISLAPLESAEEIVATLATALEFQFQNSEDETEQLLNYLRQKQMLLVMDNFEHILDGRAFIAEIHEQAAEITLIITSRERLQLHIEQLFPLKGLKVSQEESVSSDGAVASPAAQLFMNTARRFLPDYQLLEEDREHLLHICRLVEGMPLGLELAASWVGLLPLFQITAEMEQSLSILSAEHYDVPQRHQSMEAALDASWSRLTAGQQRTFKELTVFRGSFTRTSAAEVVGATLPLLVTLANKSWLTYDRQTDRYHIHELLRQYGAGKLSDNPAHEQKVREIHSLFFCDYLQKREALWHGPQQKKAAAEIGKEIDNIQHAWRWAANKGDVTLLAKGLTSLCHFYEWEGRYMDGKTNCRLAGEGLSKRPIGLDDGAQRLALWSQVLAWESQFVRGGMKKKELLARSQQLLDQAAQSGLDIRAEQAFIFLKMSDASEYRDFEEATRFGNLGLNLFQILNNRWGEAEVFKIQGYSYSVLGETDLAQDLLRNSLEISKELEDVRAIAESTTFLGIVAKHRGQFEEAESLHHQSLRLYQQLGSRFGEKSCLHHLASTLSSSGKFLAAQKTARSVLELDRELGQYPNPGSHNIFIQPTIHLGHYADARLMTHEVLEIAKQRSLAMQAGFELFYLGIIALVEGDLAGAKDYLLQSGDVLREVKQHIYQANTLANLSYVLRKQGGHDGSARDFLLEALHSGIGYHSISPIMYCLPSAALFAVDDGNSTRAVELYSLGQRFSFIANSRWFADVAYKELDEVRASLPPDVAKAAEARGYELDVWQTSELLVRELDGS